MAYVMLDFQCSLQIFQQFLKTLLLLQQALKLMKMNHKPDIAFIDCSLNKKKLVLILKETEVMSLCIR